MLVIGLIIYMKKYSAFGSICIVIVIICNSFTCLNQDDESNFSQYNIEYSSLEGENQLTLSRFPRFDSAAYLVYVNPYSQAELYGQCTWFAWGRFYEIYGYSPGFLGNGCECAYQLVNTHPDLFMLSETPTVGAIGSADVEHNHVWVVVGIDEDGNGCTIQEGNLDGQTNSYLDSLTDWRQKHYTYSQLKKKYGEVIYAIPI